MISLIVYSWSLKEKVNSAFRSKVYQQKQRCSKKNNTLLVCKKINLDSINIILDKLESNKNFIVNFIIIF